jgi:hypothetical protein
MAHNYCGGAEAKIGGVEDTKAYAGGVLSLAKQQLIRQIAQDFSSKLKIKGVKTDGDIKDIIKSLKQFVPNPKENGKTYTSDVAKQKEACKTLANIINEKMGQKIIDSSCPPGELCAKVFETLHAIFTSISGELFAVHKDVERILGNINVLGDVIERQYGRLAAVLGEVPNPNAQAVKEDYKLVQTELNRQLAMLNQMLDHLEPKRRTLEELTGEMKQFKSIVSRVKKGYVGEKDKAMGEKLAYIMAGMSTTAAAAKIVDKALTSVGMSAAQYAAIKNYADLRDKLDAGTLKALNKDTKSLMAYENAKKKLFQYQYMHDDIVKELKNKKGGDEDFENYNVPEKLGGMEIDKQLAKTRLLKHDLLKTFVRSLGDHFNNILKATESIANAVSTGQMKTGDKLDKFAQAICTLPPLDKSFMFFALSGFEYSSRATEQRERFISIVKHVVAVCDDLVKDKDYSKFEEFKSIKLNLESVMKLVIDYSERFSKGFSMVTGASESDLPSNIIKVGFDLEKVKTVISYYTRVAKIREGLRRSHKEVASLQGKYENVLGDAIGERIEKTSEELEKTKEVFNKGYGKNLFIGSKSDAAKAKLLETHSKFYNVKANMYKIAEAIDLYMASFTDQLTANPDAIKSIMEMLNNVEIMSKWYNDHSGDMLCQVFDTFPAGYVNSDPKYSKMLECIKNVSQAKNMHYFERVVLWCRLGEGDFRANAPLSLNTGSSAFHEVATKMVAHANWNAVVADANNKKYAEGTPIDGGNTAVMSFPGNPFLGLPIFGNNLQPYDRIEFKKLEDMLDKSLSVNILKNLISIFVNVADKFGNVKVSDKSSMSPIQIFRGLSDYIKYSALACGTDKYAISKDVKLNGFHYVKAAVKSVAIGVAGNEDPVFEPNKTYQVDGEDVIRIGSDGNLLSSGVTKQLVEGLSNRISELSKYANDARTAFAKVRGLYMDIDVSDNAGNAAKMSTIHVGYNFSLKVIACINLAGDNRPAAAGGAGLAGAESFVCVNGANINPPAAKDGLIAVMKQIAECVLNLGKWTYGVNKLMEDLLYISQNEKTESAAKLVKEIVISSNLKQQISDIVTLLNKPDNLLAADNPPFDDMSPMRIFTYLLHPSAAGAGRIATMAAHPGAEYISFVNQYLLPYATSDILGQLYQMNTQAASLSAAGIVGISPIISKDNSLAAPLGNIINSWNGAAMTDLINRLSSIKINSAANENVRKTDEVLWKEFGTVGMRGVGEFMSKAKAMCFLKGRSSVDPTDKTDISAIEATSYSPFNDIFHETDEIFVMCIKSIVAKILTTVGTFNIFNRQYNPDGAGFHSGLRMILGGDEDSGNVRIIDEALELYMRMPLLIEFYKKVMDIENASNSIGIIPEMDNIFGGLLRLIFVKNNKLVDGQYADSDIREIIIECNKIYVARKDKSINEIVNEFIGEVNARYGLVTEKDRDAYRENRKEMQEYNDYDPEESLGNTPLNLPLDGIDENDVSKRQAPSDKYGSVKSLDFRKHKYEIKSNQRATINKLRRNIEKMFEAVQNSKQISRGS